LKVQAKEDVASNRRLLATYKCCFIYLLEDDAPVEDLILSSPLHVSLVLDDILETLEEDIPKQG